MPSALRFVSRRLAWSHAIAKPASTGAGVSNATRTGCGFTRMSGSCERNIACATPFAPLSTTNPAFDWRRFATACHAALSSSFDARSSTANSACAPALVGGARAAFGALLPPRGLPASRPEGRRRGCGVLRRTQLAPGHSGDQAVRMVQPASTCGFRQAPRLRGSLRSSGRSPRPRTAPACRVRRLFVSSETLTSGMAQPCCWRYGRVALQRIPLSQTPFSWRRQDNGNPKAPVAGRNTAELRCVGVRVTPVFPHFLRHQPDHERQQDRQGNAEEQAIGQAKHENADSQRNAIFSKTFVPNHPAERTKPPFDLAIAVHPTRA